MQRQPITKRQRRLEIHIFPKSDKYLARRSYPPGMHGPTKSSRQLSEYGIQLREKQRVKFIYGLQERQLNRIYQVAKRSRQSTGASLVTLLERRLDNVIYRSGLARSRSQSRQWITHGHITVDSHQVRQPSYLVKQNNLINLRSKKTEPADKGLKAPDWLSVDYKNQTIQVKDLPTRDQIITELQEQLIVEFYSR